MSGWIILREDIAVATLAVSDPDFEATQPLTLPAGALFIAPLPRMEGGGPPVEYIFVVYGYTDLDVNVSGTVTAQVIERAPLTGRRSGVHYVGSVPNIAIPLGRGFVVPGRSFHGLTVRLSSLVAVGATKLAVHWKYLR